MNNPERAAFSARLIAQRLFALLLLIIGLALGYLGGQLALAGGSWYYILCALAVVASGVLLWRGRKLGAQIYFGMLLATWVWAFWEVGLDGWALAPRVAGPTVLALWLLTPWAYPREPKVSSSQGSRRPKAVAASLALAVAALGGALVLDKANPLSAAASAPVVSADAADGEWPVWGRDEGGQRFSPLTQITPDNVGKLEKVWEYRTGFTPGKRASAFEVTPLKIRDRLYLCTPDNDIIALDAETGAERWRYKASSKDGQLSLNVCRGVTYYRDPAVVDGPCAERLITATVDARLIAVDLKDGRLCRAFGTDGVVDLSIGMGIPAPGFYYVTSAPTIVRGKVVFGGFSPSSRQFGAPGGVIRAYDAVTGKFAWAFDAGRPDDHSEPAPGKTYTPDTSNSWAPISADEALGLVYIPNGGPVPDWYGGQRRAFDDKFGTAVIALEADTGKLRWSFQTTRHDLWDYDVPAQPALYDMPVAGGGRVPALIQLTKRGDIFVLDRRTGAPITAVEERAVPASPVPGERASKTQPFSVGMPSVEGPRLTEKAMWGLTPIDQAWCRLAFKTSAYEGPMTPTHVDRPTIIYPGYAGGSNWGGASIDGDRDLLVTNSLRLALVTQLIPREKADQSKIGSGPFGQKGTPYAASVKPFFSPLKMPCQQPPWGMMHAIDLKARKMVWSKPFGTPRDSGPLGIPSMIPLTIGMPNAGGPLATKSGLTFIGASQDRYLRAYDTRTGKVLWKADLPAGGQANPMSYLSPSGRQVVVIAAGGHPGFQARAGDYLVAYALPAKP